MAFLHEDFSREERNLLLASLFHDIGMFWQRTCEKEASDAVKSKYEAFFKARGRENPSHQEWSAYFCEKFIKIPEVADAVLNHHEPSGIFHYFLSAADRLSAGKSIDLSGEISEDVTQLTSLLAAVKLNGRGQEDRYYKKLVPLRDYSMPRKEPSPNPEEHYKNLWESFLEDFKSVKDFDGTAELTKLCTILEEYTFNVPSAYYYSLPDISLWAHLKTTAAIAFALYRELEGKPESEVMGKLQGIVRDPASVEEELFCLVKGDISGIQDFVYDTQMDGATKALRGRSFYLSYLMTAIAKYILRKERLPLTNLLYSGGGHFYLIMPSSFIKKLDEYRREMDLLFMEAHQGKLAMLLSFAPLKPADFMDGQGSLPEKFNKLAELLQDEKNKKFYSVLREEPGSFFGPFEEKGDPCPHCGNALYGDECGFCKSFEVLGERLIKKKFLVEKWDGTGKNEKPVRRAQDIFEKLGLELEFTDESPGRGYCFAIKREALDLTRCCGYLQIPVGMKQDREGNIITFDQISDSARGIKVWGVLRGDVDNLGSIFKDGLGEITSFSRIITLSQEVSQFFNSNLELLLDGLHEADRFHNYENCSVVYAGGDDFFIVGPWDALPYVAEHINGEFRKYVGFNPAVTLSIAFEIAPDRKFPLYRVALSAGENLDEAKHFREEKNCFAFLGMPIGWENYEKFKELKEKITEVLVRYKVSRSLLSIVYRAFREYETSLESGEIYRSWRLFYYIARLKERCGKEAQEILDQILCALIEKDNRLYPYGFLSARWAEFETRR